MKLGAGEAVRIADGDSTLFVLPTDAGLVVVSCSASPQVSAACPASAGSLELAGGGKAVAPGPTDEGARELSGALTRLSDGIENPAEDLASAKSASSQATAASDLAREFRTASREVRRATVGALASDARDDLASALGAVAAAWTRYSNAADAGSSSGVSSARGAVDERTSARQASPRGARGRGISTSRRLSKMRAWIVAVVVVVVVGAVGLPGRRRGRGRRRRPERVGRRRREREQAGPDAGERPVGAEHEDVVGVELERRLVEQQQRRRLKLKQRGQLKQQRRLQQRRELVSSSSGSGGGSSSSSSNTPPPPPPPPPPPASSGGSGGEESIEE